MFSRMSSLTLAPELNDFVLFPTLLFLTLRECVWLLIRELAEAFSAYDVDSFPDYEDRKVMACI